MPKEDLFRIKQALLQALFGIRVNTDKSVEAAIDHFDNALQQVLLTQPMCLLWE